MYITFKILIIISIEVYIFSNETVINAIDAHTKMLPTIENSTKINNIDMLEAVRFQNIKWTLRLDVRMNQGEIKVISTKQAEIRNKCVTKIVIIVESAEGRYMTTSVLPDP